MKIKTVIKGFLATASIFAAISIQAQETTKQIIVEKEIITDDATISIERDVNMDMKDGKKKIRIVKKDGDNEEVIEWEGEGEIPENIKQELKAIKEESRSSADDHRMTKESKMKIVTIDDEGNEEVMEWDGDGEMPSEMRSAMRDAKGKNGEVRKMRTTDKNGNVIESRERPSDWKEKEGDMQRRGKPNHQKGDWKEMDKKAMKEHHEQMGRGMGQEGQRGQRNDNKVKLGVKIEETAAGIVVDKVVPGTGAADGGIQEGDIITQIEDTPIDSVDRVFAELGTHNPGDKVTVRVLRQGKSKKIKVVLK